MSRFLSILLLCILCAPGLAAGLDRRIDLHEHVVDGRRPRVLHILGYMREYSSLTTPHDTVFLFREKLVDFVISDSRTRFDGWRTARILASKSYYRFTDADGRDSVSDTYPRHFSWSDLVGVPRDEWLTADSVIPSRYGASERWSRESDRLSHRVDILVDSANLQRVPMLRQFVTDPALDFRNLVIENYYDDPQDVASPDTWAGMTLSIESKGRGERLLTDPAASSQYADTYAELYVLDREYLTEREARRLRKAHLSWDDIAPTLTHIIPPHESDIDRLIARVDALDHDAVRLGREPDRRYVSAHVLSGKNNYGILKRLKYIARQLIPFHKKYDWEK